MANLVEVFFGIITRQASDAVIGRFIDGWNERCHPFNWTKTAECPPSKNFRGGTLVRARRV